MTLGQYYDLKIQAQGRIVIPQAVRAELGVQEGDEVLLVHTANGFEITTRAALLERVTGCLARQDGRDLTAEFLAERRQEAEAKEW